MAGYDYKGTKITGTSTTAKVFGKSGIKKAEKGQTYFNTDTGRHYKCTSGGKADEAKWKYVGTEVTEKPDKPVSLSAPKRRDGGSHMFDAKWTVPKSLLSKDNNCRAEGLYENWKLVTSGADPVDVFKQKKESDTEDSCNANGFDADKPKKKTYKRSDFYPYKGKPKLTGVSITVQPYNKKGKGEKATRTFEVKTPRKPKLGEATIDEDGKVSCTVTTNPGEDERERHDTLVEVDVYDSSESNPKYKTASTVTTGKTEYTAEMQIANWQVAGKYVKVRFRARARGWAGDSGWSDYKEHVVGWPNAAVIVEGGVTVPSLDSTAVATFPIKVNGDSNHKTDRVVLQKLVNVTAATPEEATAMTDQWESTDYKDDGKCTALACSVGDLLPDPGKTTWVRVKSWHDFEGIFYVYSKPYRVTQLESTPATASDDAVKLFEPQQGVNGTSARVTMAWNADGTDDSDGTQLSWSGEPDAWESTERPTEFEFTESDGELVDGGTAYRDSRTIVVKGLSEGEPTYLRARRYMDDADGVRTYGPYSDQQVIIPSVAPSDVVLSAPPYVAEGGGVQYSWAFGGGGTQKAWQVVDAATGAIVAEGADAFGTATVDAARIASFSVAGAVSAYVRVSTGGDFVASEPETTTIAQAPTLSVGELPTMTSQGDYSIPLACSSSTASVAMTVTSNGAVRATPSGVQQQPAGDTVWSYAAKPEWAPSAGAWTADIPIPEGRDFLDRGTYTVTATATDDETGLGSAPRSAG